MTGKFIVFEGGDGTGKTTQVNLVKEYLEEKGLSVVKTREPGGVKTAEKIRNIILEDNIDPVTEALLFAGARREHLKEKVIPALNDKKVVLCDRFIYSSLAYQGHARGLGIENVYNINQFAIEDLMPDLTILLELDSVNDGLERINTNRSSEINRLDLEGLDFHNKVREGYSKVAEMFPGNHCIKINASQPIESMFEDIKKALATIGL